MQAWIPYIPNFLLLFCRISAFFVVAPIFSTRGVPVQLKIGLSFFIAFLTLTASGLREAVPMDGMYVLFIVRETLVGLLLGFAAYMFFTAVQIAGSFIDIQMGLGLANVIDPMTGAQSPIVGNFKFIVAVLLFLAFNGHLLLIDGILKSYEWIPLSNELFARIYEGGVSDFLVRAFTDVFALALQMSAPLVVTLFLTDVGLGILAKTAPQFNIFVVGIPVKLIVGFLLMLMIIPGFLHLFQDLFGSLFKSLEQIVRLVGTEPKH